MSSTMITLAVSGIEASVLVLLGIGFCVGFLSGLLGVGGGWLISPALNMIGMPMPYAIGTGLAQMAGTSLFALSRHRKYGNYDLKIGIIIGVFMIIGLEGGKTLLLYLESLGLADSYTRILYFFLLGFMGITMMRDSLKARKVQASSPTNTKGSTGEESTPSAGSGSGSGNGNGNGNGDDAPWEELVTEQSDPPRKLARRRLGPVIHSETADRPMSALTLIALGLLGGALSGLLGVGGGFILMPAMVYILRMRTLAAVATSLICVLISSSYGTVAFSIAERVDYQAVLILLAGSLSGSYLGVLATKYIDGTGLKTIFAGLVLTASVSILISEFGYVGIARLMIFTVAGLVTLNAIAKVLLAIIKAPDKNPAG